MIILCEVCRVLLGFIELERESLWLAFPRGSSIRTHKVMHKFKGKIMKRLR
jgi:hypothetical protein